MKTWMRVLVLAVVIPLMASGVNIDQTIAVGSGEIAVEFNTESGLLYEVWASTSLTKPLWFGPLFSTVGSNNTQNVSFPVEGQAQRYFQIRATELAPTLAEFRDLVVGTTIPNTAYLITSPTAYTWNGEPGSWTYAKTGRDTAVLVFTYTEYGDDPSLYREEIVLTYAGNGFGTFRYSEYTYNAEDPSPKISAFRIDPHLDHLAACRT